MKMLRFKFDQNCTKNEEFDIFKGQGEWGGRGEEVDLHLKILLSIIISK